MKIQKLITLVCLLAFGSGVLSAQPCQTPQTLTPEAVLTLGNKRVSNDTLYFDIFLNKTGPSVPYYLADADFSLSLEAGAFNNPTTGRVEAPNPPFVQAGFATMAPQLGFLPANIYNFQFVWNNTSSIIPAPGYPVREQVLIRYIGVGPGTTTLATNPPYVDVTYDSGDNTTLQYNLGRFFVDGVVDPALALAMDFVTVATASRPTVTNIFWYDPIPDPTNGTICGFAMPFTTSQDFLPIELVRFEGWNIEANDNQLVWETSTEQNTSHFELLKSADGVAFEKIGEVTAAGNSQTPITYEYLDEDGFRGLNYYQLRAVDEDGTYALSEVIVIKVNLEGDVNIFPIPAISDLNVQFDSQVKQDVEIQVMDGLGRLVIRQNNTFEIGQNFVQLDVERLAAGHYVIRIIENGTSIAHTQKFSKIAP